MNKPSVNPISKFFPEPVHVDNIIDIAEIVGEEIVISSIFERIGEIRDYIIFIVEEWNGKTVAVSYGGRVIAEKLRRVNRLNGFPVSCTVFRVGNCYDIR